MSRPKCKSCGRETSRTLLFRKTKKCFECRYRDSHDPNANTGLAQLDGFAPSLWLLVQVEQYALKDIAMMFGVSAERIRQLCDKLGIEVPEYPRGMYAYRVWDDSRNRFVPVQRGKHLAEREERKRLSRRAIRERYKEEVRKHLIAAADAVYMRTRKPVTAKDVWREASGQDAPNGAAWPLIIGHLGFKHRRSSVVRKLFEDAGIPMKGRGTPVRARPARPAHPEGHR